MPEQSRLGLVLEEYAQFPQTFTNPPPTDQRLKRIARINTIMELPDGSGRRAVPDLNGKLYLVKDGVPQRLPRRRRDVRAAVLLRPRPRAGLRVRHLPPGLQAQRQVLHDPHRAGAADDRRCPDCAADRHALPRRHHRVDGRPTRPRTRSPAPAARCCASASAARSTASRRSTSTRPPGAATATTATSTSRSATAGSGVRNTDPQNLAIPHGKLLRIDPLGTQRGQRAVRDPAREPVRRPGRQARRDLRLRLPRPAPVQLGPGDRPAVPRPHRRARHRGDLRGAGRRQLRLERARGRVRLRQ